MAISVNKIIGGGIYFTVFEGYNTTSAFAYVCRKNMEDILANPITINLKGGGLSKAITTTRDGTYTSCTTGEMTTPQAFTSITLTTVDNPSGRTVTSPYMAGFYKDTSNTTTVFLVNNPSSSSLGDVPDGEYYMHYYNTSGAYCTEQFVKQTGANVVFYQINNIADFDETQTVVINSQAGQITPDITNNIANTAASYTGSNPFTLTVTAKTGYTFDAAPTASYTNEAQEYVTDTFQLSEDSKTATITITVDDPSIIINGSVTVKPDITNNIANTAASYTGSNPFTLTVTANTGYTFDAAPTASYTNEVQEYVTDTFQLSEDSKTATITITVDVTDTSITINGSVTPEAVEPTFTNNIPNCTYTYKGSNHSYVVSLTAADGYIFDGTPEATYQGSSSGTEVSVSFAVATDKKTASGILPDLDENITVVLSGATQLAEYVTVVNNITGTTEAHTYSGGVLAVTVSGKQTHYRYKSATITYINASGVSVTEDMNITVGSTINAEATVTAQNHSTATIAGAFEYVTYITSDLSNCTSSTLPEYIFKGDTLSVTVTANENTLFESTPYFAYQSEEGTPEQTAFTVSTDKKTATGNMTAPDYTLANINVYAYATPQKVIGDNYGAINVYKVTLDNLDAFSKQRFFTETTTSEGEISITRIDLGEWVNRIKRIYTNVPTSSTDVIKCGNYNTGISCLAPSTDTVTLDFGTCVIPAHSSSSLDYDQQVQMFLPFRGFVTVPNEYAGKEVGLKYTVNIITGGGVAILSHNGINIMYEEVTASQDILYTTSTNEVKTIGADTWDDRALYGLEPYMKVIYYNAINADGSNNDNCRGLISTFTGFVQFDDISLSTSASMCAQEQAEILQLLREGVYINE